MASLDLAQLDAAVSAFYSGSQSQMVAADAALAGLREYWWAAGPIQLLEALVGRGAATPTVLWAASLAEQWVRRRWRRISTDERDGCRATLVQLVIATAEQRAAGPERKLVSAKMEQLLAALLRADWPTGWPSFLPDLLQATQLDDAARLRISLLLAEEAVVLRTGSKDGEANGGHEANSGSPIRGGSVQLPAVRALFEANSGQQAAQLLALCHRAIGHHQAACSGPQAASGAPSGELIQLGLNVVARFAPCLPVSLLLSRDLLDVLPKLLERFRCSVLKLLAELSRADVPLGTPQAHAEALVHLHTTMREIFGRVLSKLPAQLIQAFGQPDQGEPSWTWGDAQLDDLSLWLATLWSGQRNQLAQTEQGCELALAAMQLLGALGDASHKGSERERICVEHACCVAADLRQSAVLRQPAGPFAPAVAAARDAAVRLLCMRISRPAGMLLWVDEDDDDDPEVQEELPTEASAAADEMHESAATALRLLFEHSPEYAQHALNATLARLGEAASRGPAALGKCCQASWSLAAQLRAAPSAQAAPVCARAIAGLTQSARSTRYPCCKRVLEACAALLIAHFPLGLHGGENDLLRGMVSLLLEWLKDSSEAMSRMSGAALRAVCSAPQLAPALWGGAEPFLVGLLGALPSALVTTPLSEQQMLAVHDALGRALAASLACGALLAASLQSCVDQLLSYVHQRWAPLIEVLCASSPPADDALVEIARVASLLLRIYSRVIEDLGRTVLLHHLEALSQSLLSLVRICCTQLAQRMQAASNGAPDTLAKALGSLPVRRLRSARAETLEVLVRVCSTPAASHADGGENDDERAFGLASPFVQLLLPYLATEPLALRPPQLAHLVRTLIERAPAYRGMTTSDLRHGVALVLRPTLEAAAAAELAVGADGKVPGSAAAGSLVAAAGGTDRVDRDRGVAQSCAAVGLVGALATQRPDALVDAPADFGELLVNAIARALSQQKPPLTLIGDAIRTLHALMHLHALPTDAHFAMMTRLRRTLAGVQTTAELQLLCRRLQLSGEGSRMELHAALLGLSLKDFEDLHAQESAESEAEHEAFWLDD